MSERRAGPLRWRSIESVLLIRPEERGTVAWSTAYFFFLLAANSVLKPVRDAAGVKEGFATLPRILTLTFLCMAAAIPAYNFAITRLPRTRVATAVHRATQVGLLLFVTLGFGLKLWGSGALGTAFFVWLSVFNLLGVAALRTAMVDVWRERQAARVFGAIGVGGTLGVVAGAGVARWLAPVGGLWPLFLVALVLLEVALRSSRRAIAGLPRSAHELGPSGGTPGSTLTALRLVATEPLFRKMAAFVALSSVCTTLLYLEQARIVRRDFLTDVARVGALATIDMVAAIVTIAAEIFAAGRLIRAFGARRVLILLPLGVSLLFAALRVSPTFAVLLFAQAATRGLNYGLATPARESLFADLAPALKYRGKSVIDTLAWRAGDFVGIWVPSFAATVGASGTTAAVAAGALWTLCAVMFALPDRRAEPAAVAS